MLGALSLTRHVHIKLLSGSHSCPFISSHNLENYFGEKQILDITDGSLDFKHICYMRQMIRKHICGVTGSYPTFVGFRKWDNRSPRLRLLIVPASFGFLYRLFKSVCRGTLSGVFKEKMRRKVIVTWGHKLTSIRKTRGQSRINAGAVSQSSLMTPDLLSFALGHWYSAITAPLFSTKRLRLCVFISKLCVGINSPVL